MLGRCGSEIDAISKMTAELPGQAPHAFGLVAAAERAAELGHPTSSMRSASFESSHTKAHEGRVTEGRVLMFGMPRELFRSRCSIRLPGGSWSEGFYLGSLAAGGVVAVDERDAAPAAVAASETRAERGERTADSQARQTYELGVSSGMAGGPFWRTKLITICYRFMLSNRCGRGLMLRQVGGKSAPLLLPAGQVPAVESHPCSRCNHLNATDLSTQPVRRALWQRCAWNWPQRNGTSFSTQPMMSVCLVGESGARGRWSSAFGLHDLGEIALKLWAAADGGAAASAVGGTRSHGAHGSHSNSLGAASAGGLADQLPRDPPFVLRVEISLLRATVLVRFIAEDKTT